MFSVSARRSIVRTLVVWLLTAILLVVYLQPRSNAPALELAGVVLLVNLLAFLMAYFLSGGGRGHLVIRTILTPLLVALVIVFLLVPTNDPGFDAISLVLFGLELVGMLAAYVIVRE